MLTDYKTIIWLLYVFFWVIHRHLNFICRRFGTLCLFHLHRQVGTYLPMKMEQCSETSAYKIQTPGNYPEENIQHTEHGGSLKSRIHFLVDYRIMTPVLRLWTILTLLTLTPKSALDATLQRFNPLNPKLNPICHLLTLLGAHILHISTIRVN